MFSAFMAPLDTPACPFRSVLAGLSHPLTQLSHASHILTAGIPTDRQGKNNHVTDMDIAPAEQFFSAESREAPAHRRGVPPRRGAGGPPPRGAASSPSASRPTPRPCSR